MVVPDGRPVVNDLHAQLPPGSLRCALIFELSEPKGFWTLLHPGCERSGLLTHVSHRAQRGAA